MKTSVKLVLLFLLMSVGVAPDSGIAADSLEQTDEFYRMYIPFAVSAERVPYGTAVHNGFMDDPAYMEILVDSFSQFTPENCAKYYHVSVYGWDEMDRLVAFAELTGKEVHYHTLAWAYWTQPPDQLAWVIEAMSRYPQIKNWDVVNEGYSYDGTPVLDNIEGIFQTARNTLPDAVLWYNGLLTYKGEQEQAKRLVVEGYADAIGIELHLHAFSDLSTFMPLINWLADNEVPWRISELDIAIPEITDYYLQAQANKYREVIWLTREYKASSLTLWNFTDKYSWLDERYPTPFDANMLPKPAWTFFIPSEE